MKPYILFMFFVFSTFSFAQKTEIDSIQNGINLTNYNIEKDTIKLPEIVIHKDNMNLEDRKAFELLQKRVLRVYPYAKIAADRLTSLNKGLQNLSSNKDKKIYMKIAEEYLTNEFEARLKKLSRKQGQILVKLIHRQTGKTTYELIKELKSGWRAFWSNATASLFDISLKRPYSPYTSNEDFWIETILTRAFENGYLQEQTAHTPVDLEKLTTFWEQKQIELKKENKL